jgi:hypothetical protein
MSLEDAVAANTAAVQALTVAVNAALNVRTAAPAAVLPPAAIVPTPPLPAAPMGAVTPGGPVRPGAPAAGPAKPRGRPPGAAASTPAAPAQQPVTLPSPALPAGAAAGATYEQVATAIQAVCEQLGNRVGVSILAQFNASHGKQLTPDVYRQVIDKCNEALVSTPAGALT